MPHGALEVAHGSKFGFELLWDAALSNFVFIIFVLEKILECISHDA
jgi:hypothetical protein